MKRIDFLAVMFFTIIQSAYALEHKPKLWIGGDFDAGIVGTNDWRYNVFLQARLGDNDAHLDQSIVRPSIYYLYNPNLSFWLGYDYIPTAHTNRVGTFLEQRVWPQLLYKKQLNSRNELALRTRLEARWQETNAPVSYRLRQRVELTIKYKNFLGVDFSVFDEIFFTLRSADWAPTQTISQNRIFLGLVKPVNQNLSVDFGYMNIFKPRSDQYIMDHVLVLGFDFNLDGQSSHIIQGV